MDPMESSHEDLALWIEKLHGLVLRNEGMCACLSLSGLCLLLTWSGCYVAASESVSARETIASRIVQALGSVVAAEKEHRIQDDGTFQRSARYTSRVIHMLTFWVVALLQLLTSCKVLMRDRRGIEKLLTAEVCKRASWLSNGRRLVSY